MISLKTLGGLAIVIDGRLVEGAPAQPRRLALLALLAGAGDRGVSRDRLLSLLWPESDTERARHALAQLLHILQRDQSQIGIRGSTELRLDPDTVGTDLREFDEALRHGDRERAIALYAGPFLDGFHLDGAPEFERWADAERARLAADYAAALETLAGELGRRGEHARAVQQWRRLAGLDPLNARLAIGLMGALRDAGDRAGAIRHARVYQELVRQELGGTVDPDVVALADRIQNAPASTTATPVPAPATRTAGPAAAPTAATAGDAPAVALPPAARGAPRLAIAAGAIALGVVTALFAIRPRAGTHLDPKRVLVAVFENRTGDPALGVLGDITADYLARGLAGTRLVSEVIDARTEAGDSGAAHGAGPAASRALAQRVGAGTVVWGSYYRRGDSLRFEGEVLDAAGGTVLHALNPVTAAAGDETGAVELLRQRVMAGFAVLFGPAFEAWQARSRPPTYEAYQEVLAGDYWLSRYSYPDALAHYRRAIALDSGYTDARTRAAEVLALAGNCRAVDSTAASLDPMLTRLPPVDRGHLDWARATCRGDWSGALEAARQVLASAPRSTSFVALVTVSALELGRPREALRTLDRIEPEKSAINPILVANFRDWRALAYHELGDHEAELRIERQGLATTLRIRHTNSLLGEAVALAALGRVAEIDRRLETWPVTPPGDIPSTGDLFLVTALELRAHGQIMASRSVLERAAVWYRSRPPEEAARSGFISLRGLFGVAYYRERWDEARALYERVAATDSSSVTARAALGALAARRGDTATAARMEEWLAPRAGTHGHASMVGGEATYARARIAALLGQRERAVSLLRRAFDEGHGKIFVHFDPDLESLRGYAPFDELLRPSG
jgi:DNA-binding SARP family transcriptional activator/TolB-like protein